MRLKKMLFILSLTASYNMSYAQAEAQDSTLATSEEKSNSFTSIFYGEPGKAALFALVIPSGGQAYNKKYWKIPIALAIEYYAFKNLSQSIKEVRKMSDCRRSYIDEDTSLSDRCIRTDEMMTVISEDEVFEEWNAARGKKETAWMIMGGAHLLTIVEAFVDRHLINFDTDEDISYHNMPSSDYNRSANVVAPSIDIITIRIPLNKSRTSR